VPQLHRALQAVSDVVARGGRVLFVGTKRQAQRNHDSNRLNELTMLKFELAKRERDLAKWSPASA